MANGDLFNKETAAFEFPDTATNLANMGLPTYCYDSSATVATLAADALELVETKPSGPVLSSTCKVCCQVLE